MAHENEHCSSIRHCATISFGSHVIQSVSDKNNFKAADDQHEIDDPVSTLIAKAEK